MTDEGICEITCIDGPKVTSVKKRLLPDDVLLNLAQIFKVLGDSTRAKIIHALTIEELCVCDIASLLSTSKSAVSHQLRVLRNMRIVRFRKAGKIVYYSLDDSHIERLFNEALHHVTDNRDGRNY